MIPAWPTMPTVGMALPAAGTPEYQVVMEGIRADTALVLAWHLTGPAADLPPVDVAEDLLDQVRAHGRALAARLEFDYRTLPPTSQAAAVARIVLGETARRLDELPPAQTSRAVAGRAQNLARLVRALDRAAIAVRAETAHTETKGN